jgi:hypothetical protein
VGSRWLGRAMPAAAAAITLFYGKCARGAGPLSHARVICGEGGVDTGCPFPGLASAALCGLPGGRQLNAAERSAKCELRPDVRNLFRPL